MAAPATAGTCIAPTVIGRTRVGSRPGASPARSATALNKMAAMFGRSVAAGVPALSPAQRRIDRIVLTAQTAPTAQTALSVLSALSASMGPSG